MRRRWRRPGVAMSYPELSDKAMRVFREDKALRESARSHRPRSARDHNQTSSRHGHVRNLLNRNVEVHWIKVVLVLLVQVNAIGQADSEPASRINLDTTKRINWIVVECVRRMAANVHRRS